MQYQHSLFWETLTSLSSCISILPCAGNLCFLNEAWYNSPERKRDITEYINIWMPHPSQTSVELRYSYGFKTERFTFCGQTEQQSSLQSCVIQSPLFLTATSVTRFSVTRFKSLWKGILYQHRYCLSSVPFWNRLKWWTLQYYFV